MMKKALGNVSCDLDLKSQGQIMYLLVNTSPKLLDVAISNFTSKVKVKGQIMYYLVKAPPNCWT